MAVQVSYTDPNTGDVTTGLYLRIVGVNLNLLNREHTTVVIGGYTSLAARNAGKAPKLWWHIPIAEFSMDNARQSIDLTLLNTVLGMPVEESGLAANAAYNAMQTRIYTWFKNRGAAKVGINLTGSTDV